MKVTIDLAESSNLNVSLGTITMDERTAELIAAQLAAGNGYRLGGWLSFGKLVKLTLDAVPVVRRDVTLHDITQSMLAKQWRKYASGIMEADGTVTAFDKTTLDARCDKTSTSLDQFRRWTSRPFTNDAAHQAEPTVVIPPCPECGYGHIDNGDGTSTTTMRRSAMIFGQDCKKCGVRFGHDAKATVGGGK